jgi:hypothetical protein
LTPEELSLVPGAVGCLFLWDLCDIRGGGAGDWEEKGSVGRPEAETATLYQHMLFYIYSEMSVIPPGAVSANRKRGPAPKS